MPTIVERLDHRPKHFHLLRAELKPGKLAREEPIGGKEAGQLFLIQRSLFARGTQGAYGAPQARFEGSQVQASGSHASSGAGLSLVARGQQLASGPAASRCQDSDVGQDAGVQRACPLQQGQQHCVGHLGVREGSMRLGVHQP